MGSANMTTSSPSQFTTSRLLNLPPELRELIYIFATTDQPALPATCRRKSEPGLIPPLAQTCKQLWHEVLALVFRHHALKVDLGDELPIFRAGYWLDRWRERDVDFRHVIFNGLIWFPPAAVPGACERRRGPSGPYE